MEENNQLKNFTKVNDIYVSKNDKNIFVNDRELNRKILDALSNKEKNTLFKNNYPNYWNMIYSPKREAILEIMEIDHNDECADLGSMWGVHTVGLAKRSKKVFSVDQTYDSLEIVKRRCEIEKLNNVILINDDLKKFKINNHFDKILVNGVLEWIPTIDNVVLSEEYGKFSKKKNSSNPLKMQINFLQNVFDSLKKNGKLCLAIENRYDYKHFLGSPDPHNNLKFTTILPRFVANIVSKIFLGRNYENYTYSFAKLKEIFTTLGFKNICLYAVFPHYHEPELIIHYDNFKFYKRYWDWNNLKLKSKIKFSIEYILMKVFRLKFLSPSIIIVASK